MAQEVPRWGRHRTDWVGGSAQSQTEFPQMWYLTKGTISDRLATLAWSFDQACLQLALVYHGGTKQNSPQRGMDGHHNTNKSQKGVLKMVDNTKGGLMVG